MKCVPDCVLMHGIRDWGRAVAFRSSQGAVYALQELQINGQQ